MAIENANELFPPIRTIEGLDVIGKYRDSLNLLKRERNNLKKMIKDKGIKDDNINKNISRLDKKIIKLESMIAKWDKEHSNE